MKILIAISMSTFWVKNPADLRVFSCFYDKISQLIVDISAFVKILIIYLHFFLEDQYQQNIEKKILKILLSILIRRINIDIDMAILENIDISNRTFLKISILILLK